MDEKLKEEFIILLLGSVDEPIPSLWHVQKEMFIFSRLNPRVQDLFQFKRHYNGAFSLILSEILEEPMYYEHTYSYDSKIGGYYLLNNGKKRYNEILIQNKNNKKFLKMLNALKLIRKLYDKLSNDELLFLMYITYKEFVELSNKYDQLVENNQKRLELASSIYKKGLVTKRRYEELINYAV